MFDIRKTSNGTVHIKGRLDAARASEAQAVLDQLDRLGVIDMQALEYISSAGLGVLLRTHKRLLAGGGGLKLVNVSKHINDIFSYSGFDRLFEIVPAREEG